MNRAQKKPRGRGERGRKIKKEVRDNGLKAPSPPRKRHPSTEGNFSIHSPIEGGFRGCAFFLFYSFLLILIFSGYTLRNVEI